MNRVQVQKGQGFYYKWNLIISLLLNFKQRIAQRFIQSVTFVRFCKMAVHLIEIVIYQKVWADVFIHALYI